MSNDIHNVTIFQQQEDDDPHGIQKLLNILRSQQDGQVQENANGINVKRDSQVQRSSSSPSFTRSEKTIESEPNRRSNADLLPLVQQSIKSTPSPADSREDLRFISFAQALPHLSKLSKDEKFLEQLLSIKVS